jgi:hypothetical protein
MLDELRKKLDSAFDCIGGRSLIVEVSLKELMRSTKPIVRKRSIGYTTNFRVQLIKRDKQKFYFWVKKPTTKRYNVNIEFQGNNPDMTRDDVKVSCTCGYFKWFGCDYNSREMDFNLRKMSDGSPPDIRDPHREHWICKHIYAVSKVLIDYLTSVKKK